MKYFLLIGVMTLTLLGLGYDSVYASHEGAHHEETKHNAGHKKIVFI